MKILLLGDRKLDYYKKALEYLNVEYDTLDNMKDLSFYDGLIIPGGIDVCPKFYNEKKDETVKETDEEFDKLQMNVVKHFIESKKRILGICRGQQLLNVMFNGSLIQNIKTDIEHVGSFDLKKDLYHEIENVDGFMKTIYGNKGVVNSYHHQAIKKIGDGLKSVSCSNDGIIEAVEHESLPIIGVQFHPERMCLDLKQSDVLDGIEIFKHFIELKNGD